MKLSEELQQRGFIHQSTASNLADIIDKENRVVYHGFDPSADSIHAGNFVQWMLLVHLVRHGHTVVLLVGGATGRIGDPKPDSERPLIPEEEINRRVGKMKAQAELLLGSTVELVNNYDWFQKILFLDFLRDIGKHFTVNELIKKDAIATRLQSDTGLSYTEFAYPLVQGYDYLVLFREKNCTIQTGGSDQWGNMVAGVELIRRVERAEAHVITTPLIIDKTTGKKFGKSEGNAVWLDANKTTPYEFYQFWYNTSDENVVDYLKLFTTLSLEDIAKITEEHEVSPEKRLAQTALAKSVTSFVHSEETMEGVKLVSSLLFGEVQLSEISDTEMMAVKAHAPLTEVDAEITVVEALVACGLAESKRAARTFITDGAVMVQYQKIEDENAVLKNIFSESIIHLKRGKKNVSLLLVK